VPPTPPSSPSPIPPSAEELRAAAMARRRAPAASPSTS
jgi:hypothetical protein